MTITLRSVKGSNLTVPELDGNFTDLDGRVDTLETTPPTPDEISNITVSGSQMTVHLQSGTTFGPFTIPRSRFNWRGTWATATAYYGNDVISTATGVYLVLETHTSVSPFDPNEQNTAGDPFYALMLSFDTPAPVDITSLIASDGTWTPTLAYAGKYMRCTVKADVLMPTNAEVAFEIGTEMHFVQRGSDFIRLQDATSGLTLNAPDGFDVATERRGAVMTAKKVGTDEWDVFGLLQDIGSASA